MELQSSPLFSSLLVRLTWSALVREQDLGTLLATAGGSYLKIWDVLNTGQTLRKLEKHHKTITCVGVLNNVPQVNGPRLCSVSLDQHLKVTS